RDWSSDVCSSDLVKLVGRVALEGPSAQTSALRAASTVDRLSDARPAHIRPLQHCGCRAAAPTARPVATGATIRARRPDQDSGGWPGAWAAGQRVRWLR